MSRMLLNRRRYRDSIFRSCILLTVPKIKSKRPIGLCLMLLEYPLRSRAKVIKHQGEAGEDPEGRVGGLWCSLVASGLTTGRGQVGSRPGVAAED